MAARDAFDVMSISIVIGEGANTSTDNYLFRGQKEAYSDLGLTLSESGVDPEPSTALTDSIRPILTVSQLLKSGAAVRIRASGTRTNGRTVNRSIIVAENRVKAAIAAINGVTVDGAEMKARTPTRRRLR